MSKIKNSIVAGNSKNATTTQQEANVPAKKTPKYIICRVTPGLYTNIAAKAEEAGISVSRLMLNLAEGYHPKARMTKEQEDALNQLSDARGELSHIRNALSGKSQEERLAFFRDREFMTWWVNATTKLMQDWLTIEHYFRQG